MQNDHSNLVATRQDPLRKHFRTSAEDAMITDRAKTISDVEGNPFRGTVLVGQPEYGVDLPFGIHSAVGGYHDAPNPGDMLCAALAACFDTTLRLISGRMGVQLARLEVEVSAEADVRGALVVDVSVPVGFQSMQCIVNLDTKDDTHPKTVKALFAAAENSCVNYRTLIKGVPITTSLNINANKGSAVDKVKKNSENQAA